MLKQPNIDRESVSRQLATSSENLVLKISSPAVIEFKGNDGYFFYFLFFYFVVLSL